MPCGAINPGAVFPVIPYFKTEKLISTRLLITKATGQVRGKFVSTVGPSQIHPGDGRACFPGIHSQPGTGLHQHVHENRSLWSVGCKHEAPLSFLAEAGWPSCLKTTLTAKELGVEARGRGEERRARLGGWTRDKDGGRGLDLSERLRLLGLSGEEAQVSRARPLDKRNIWCHASQPSPRSCLETKRGCPKLSLPSNPFSPRVSQCSSLPMAWC